MSTVSIEVEVLDIGAIIRAYDVIRLRRSITDETGPYNDITANAPTHASLEAVNAEPYDVVGKTLQLKIDLPDTQNIVFTGTVPLSPQLVVDQINAAIPDVATAQGNKVLITSPTTGMASAVHIVGGDAAAEFGWPVDTRVIGKEAHVALIAGQTLYDFADQDGAAGYFYEAAFFNTDTHVQSEWSDPFEGDAGPVLPPENLSLAIVDLADAQGRAMQGQRVLFYADHDPSLKVAGYGVAIDGVPLEVVTNNSGHAEIPLVRGLHVRVVFEDTSLIRDIVIPDVEEFNLLDVVATAPDPYGVVDPEIPYAIRRDL